ncbi:MAG TPA: thiosulfate oxidation carrier complex protein SoxZ [Alphaproteobacteria bacterium]|jgi:sulfur-oxidizing protein SoxZ|nr:thiosulfate oxidation carrier complex protein SoxZ [Alphaproteobacteria bacterium]
MTSARMKVPKKAKKGEIITVKSLIKHAMETGQRSGKDGKKVPRLIVNNLVCTYNGKEVFKADWWPAIAANPYLAFNLRAQESGTIELSWTDDSGKTVKKSAEMEVIS